MDNMLFAKRENRDKKYRELKGSGLKEVRRSTVRNQQLHPQYVEDLKNGISKAETGFGNSLYKTKFNVLYVVEWELLEGI